MKITTCENCDYYIKYLIVENDKICDSGTAYCDKRNIICKSSTFCEFWKKDERIRIKQKNEIEIR